jgi:beta-lactam-binding protein with PASTA domain
MHHTRTATLLTAAALTLTLAACNPATTNGTSSSKNTAAAPTTSTTTATTATLPNLIGKGLQTAQDTAQAAGFYGLSSHDSLGRARHQVLDRDWKVCSQTPAPGQHSTDATVDLGAVKLEEDCPAKDEAAPTAAGSTMPNLIGKSLAAARDTLDASTSISTKDASGQSRNIFLESNWQVCTQQPAAGATLSGQPVTFTAVKFSETCP